MKTNELPATAQRSIYGFSSYPQGLRVFGNAARDRRIDDLTRMVAKLSTDLSTAEAKIERTAGARLLVHVEELHAALEALTKANRKEFGKLWAQFREPPKAPDPVEPETADQVRARLRLEHGLPQAPTLRKATE